MKRRGDRLCFGCDEPFERTGVNIGWVWGWCDDCEEWMPLYKRKPNHYHVPRRKDNFGKFRVRIYDKCLDGQHHGED